MSILVGARVVERQEREEVIINSAVHNLGPCPCGGGDVVGLITSEPTDETEFGVAGLAYCPACTILARIGLGLKTEADAERALANADRLVESLRLVFNKCVRDSGAGSVTRG